MTERSGIEEKLHMLRCRMTKKKVICRNTILNKGVTTTLCTEKAPQQEEKPQKTSKSSVIKHVFGRLLTFDHI